MKPEDFRAARERLGLTQTEFAAVLGYGNGARISDIERGAWRRVPAQAARLVEAYLAGYRPADWPTRLDTHPSFFFATSCMGASLRVYPQGGRNRQPFVYFAPNETADLNAFLNVFDRDRSGLVSVYDPGTDRVGRRRYASFGEAIADRLALKPGAANAIDAEIARILANAAQLEAAQ